MAIDVVQASADAPVATNGTLTFSYPAGRTADSYAQTAGAVLAVPQTQGYYAQGTGCSLAYGTTSVTVTYLGTTTIPAQSGSAVLLQLPLQEPPTVALGGAASQANTDAPIAVPQAGYQPQVNPVQVSLIDFGAFPGTDTVSLVIQGQPNIAAASRVEAWIAPVATVDHSADEHVIDPPRVLADTVVPGVGFTIYAASQSQSPDAATYGKWTVYWQWF